MKSLLFTYIRLLAFMAYGISLLVSAKVFAFPKTSAADFENHETLIESCDISNNTNTTTVPSTSDDDDTSGDMELCAGGCKYLLSFSFDCIKSISLTASNFHWKFHYESPHGEILSDPPRGN